MNFRKLSLLFLLVVFSLSTITANAVSAGYHANIYCCETVAQQAWYTKLIKLDNFNRKDVSGTLNFQLVPYEGVDKEYKGEISPEEGGEQIDLGDEEGLNSKVRKGPPGSEGEGFEDSVKIVPGVTEFSYKVPFSSEDYADKKFNDLALGTDQPAGNSLDLFNHAVLHEWGRIETADNNITIRIGKLYEDQFENKDLNLSQNEVKGIYEKQKADAKKPEYKLSWPGDPDTEGVVGWKNTFGRNYYNSEDHLYDFLGDSKFDSDFLNKHENFKKGKFNLEDYVSPNLGMVEGTNFYLRMTTRPIAISKEYDAQGNISSIEKPLIPSKDAYNFIQMHNDVLKSKYNDNVNGYVRDKVFRYKLIEKSPEGIDLKPSEKSLIVDVIAGGDLQNDIYVFKDEDSADEFYKNFSEKLGAPIDASILHDNFIFSKENKVQLVNEINRYTITVDPNGGNWDGDTANIVKNAVKGDSFILTEAPKKDGYKFLYWKGSEYKPGQEYIVQGDHTFIAEWKKNDSKIIKSNPKTGDSCRTMLYSGFLLVIFTSLLIVLRNRCANKS